MDTYSPASTVKRRKLTAAQDDTTSEYFLQTETSLPASHRNCREAAGGSSVTLMQATRTRLARPFYEVSCEQLALNLLGKILVRQLDDGTVLRGRIVETECYLGGDDKASHSFQGKRTPRNTAMFMAPGTAYVYMTYGMYYCFNISSQGDGAAVLLRSAEPLEGMEMMEKLRLSHRKQSGAKSLRPHQLCNGPAKLCLAFDVTKAFDRLDLTNRESLWLEDDTASLSFSVIRSSRIGIASAGPEWAAKLLRFYILGNTSVSVRDRKGEAALVNSD